MKKDLWIWLDPTRRCNLDCALCYTKSSHAAVDMDPKSLDEMLRRLHESALVSLKKVHLNWRGEPLLNPRFVDLLRVTQRWCGDCPIEWHTNGTLITERLGREIIQHSRYETIYVSIDGGNAAAHDRHRGHGNFTKSVIGLRHLLNERGARRYPRLGLYQIDLGVEACDYDPEFMALTEVVDVWTRVNPVLMNGETVRPRYAVPGSVDERIESGLNNPADMGPCFWAGNAFCVAPNGDVSVCLLSHSAGGLLGNLLLDPVAQLLRQAAAFRLALAVRKRGSSDHCRNCVKQCGGDT
jgi:sulfatase maturation enzyme AslB (radical SAM superfamily)